MELPKYKPVDIRSLKNCNYLDCNKEFNGTPIQVYCDYHKDPHHRKRFRPVPESPEVRNQVFMHEFKRRMKAEFNCALSGCRECFEVDLTPKTFVYPKYCEQHRSEFRRNYFLRQKGLRQAS